MSNEQDISSQTIIILGMHRSGTSALTGMLQQAGLYLGNVSTYAEDNRKGNRESTTIMTLHDDLLERSGGRWDDPPERIHWSPIHYACRDLIIQNYKNHGVWGFKDPRTILTLGPWLKALPNAHLVGIFRHPYKVANSLSQRNGIALSQGLELWVKYNRILLWHHENTRKFPIIEFSTDELAFKANVNTLTSQLGLSSFHHDFFDNSLRSNRESTDEAAKAADRNANAVRIYEKLKCLST